MKKILPLATLGLAGLVGAGLMALPGTTVAANLGDDPVAKREDNITELVLVDDDHDDTGDNSRTRSRSRFTGNSRSRDDNTRSNFTRVSRDNDRSRGDKTKDWTFDGPGDTRTRDWSANRTNDRSRNDTRGRR